MKQANWLKRGDTVGIVAPARKTSKEELSFAIKTLKSWGLNVVLGKNIFCHFHQFSGTEAQRAADLQQMLDDSSIKAIFCARGGYGTLRIIDLLDFTKFKKNPKWIVGFSDITVLHAHINQTLAIASIHATMPALFSASKKAVDSLQKTLFGKKITYSFTKHPLNRGTNMKGIVVGGNLSVLYSLLGSKSDIDTKGKILFIEDLDEYLYHIDRMITAFKRADKLKNLKGLIVGGMTDMKDNKVPFGKCAEEIIYDAVKEYKYPVCFNFSAGHIKENLAILLGTNFNLLRIKHPTK